MRIGVGLRLIKEINFGLNGLPPKTEKYSWGLFKPKISKLKYTAGEITR